MISRVPRKNARDLPTYRISTRSSATELTDFNDFDESLVIVLVELYRSVRHHQHLAVQSANNMVQFLSIATAVLGGLALSYSVEPGPKIWITAMILLIALPVSVSFIFLAWIREILRQARSSIFLLRLEGKLSKLVSEIAKTFVVTSTPARSATYDNIHKIFGDRFVDWEIWMRKENPTKRDLVQMHSYVVISFVFFFIAMFSAHAGYLLCGGLLLYDCEHVKGNLTVGELLRNFAQSGRSVDWITPLKAWDIVTAGCGSQCHIFFHAIWYAYIVILAIGLSVAGYATYLLVLVLKANREVLKELYLPQKVE